MFLLSTRSLTLTIFACILIFASCSPDDDASSKRSLLTGKMWVVVQIKMNGVDITDDREDCETDNTMIFFEDGTFIADKGELRCDEFETDVEGTWRFKVNETMITIRPSGESALDWNIHELTGGTLRISQYMQPLNAKVEMIMIPK